MLLQNLKRTSVALGGVSASLLISLLTLPASAQMHAAVNHAGAGASSGCVDYSNDPAGCQPPTFATPTGSIPSRRVGRDGQLDPKASEADVRAGVALVEEKQHLFRNFVPIHWVLTVPSVKDPATGGWTGGDLDAMGDGRGLGIAGNCIYTGHGNGEGKAHAINIFKIQADPVKNPPVEVGSIPAMVQGTRGFDDRELRSIVYTSSTGEKRQLLVRNGGTQSVGRMFVYEVDPNTCLVKSQSNQYEFGGQSHEFYLWHDPANLNRLLIYVTIWTPEVPDPHSPGLKLADMYVMAITDENTGAMLKDPKVLASFTLEDAGGPRINEKPDASGLFTDGRMADYSNNKDLWGRAGNLNRVEQNKLHSISVSDDGERAYVAGTTAGFYILNTEAIAHHKDSDLAAGNAGCHLHTTIAATVDGLDITKVPELANDCVHMVVNDDPGVKAFLASNAPNDVKIRQYLKWEDRSRFDPYPPVDAVPTGTHSAVLVPGRPAEVVGNSKNRPAFVWITDENGGCPLNYARMISVESETTPSMIGAFAIPDNLLDNCLKQAITEPDGTTKRRPISQQNHNPTVFKNMVFNGWYGHGLRAIDISNPMTPREVGYAIPAPQGIVRTYPIFVNGLIYYNDNRTGLHVLRYVGPRANELPGNGSGVYEGNATSPHP